MKGWEEGGLRKMDEKREKNAREERNRVEERDNEEEEREKLEDGKGKELWNRIEKI